MQCVRETKDVKTLMAPALSEQEARIANRRLSLVLLSGYISAVNIAVGRLFSVGLLDRESLLIIDEHLFSKRRQLDRITKEAIKEVYF